MYYDYFGLKQPPFKITPDTSMFFPGGNRGAILDALIYTILNGEGIIKVVGEVGSGKTMLCRMLEKELPDNVEVVYIANPSLSPENILHAIAYDLDLAVQASTSRLEVMNKLQEYLLAKHSDGQHVVVFIEEAQSMPVATLEEIRLLSNLETQQNKLLQIVMFGQPELDDIISQREIRQLKERITYSFQLNPFSVTDIREYLNARLRTCGYRSGEIFDGKATQLIERYSAGLVRRVNILADKSMLAAFASNANNVDAGHVRKAARDSEFVSNWRKKSWLLPVIAVSALAILGTVISWQLNRARDTGEVTAGAADNYRAERAVTDPSTQQRGVTGTTPDTPANPLPGQTIVNTNKQDGAPAAGENSHFNGKHEQSSSTAPLSERDTRLSAGKRDIIGDNQGKKGRIVSTPETGVVRQSDTAGADAASDTDPGAQLMGMEGIFGPGEMGTEQFTDSELQMLRAQLERLPPEVAFHLKPSSDSNACKRCWSIIYRPLIKSKKL